LGQAQGQEARHLLVAFGQALGTDAFAQALGLFLVDGQVGGPVEIDAGLAEGGLVGAGITDEVEQRGAVLTLVDAEAFGLGEESLAALRAMAVWLEPLDGGGAT